LICHFLCEISQEIHTFTHLFVVLYNVFDIFMNVISICFVRLDVAELARERAVARLSGGATSYTFLAVVAAYIHFRFCMLTIDVL
jgi:hypothetical protein